MHSKSPGAWSKKGVLVAQWSRNYVESSGRIKATAAESYVNKLSETLSFSSLQAEELTAKNLAMLSKPDFLIGGCFFILMLVAGLRSA